MITYKKYFNYILLVITIASFPTSCKTNEKIATNSLKECIADKLLQTRREEVKYDERQSLENTLIRFEDHLLDEDYLKSATKESYLVLAEEIIKSPENYAAIFEHIIDKSNYADRLVLLNPSLLLTQCVDYVLVTNINEYGSTLHIQREFMRGIIRSNYEDFQLISEMMNSIDSDDFAKNIFHRIPMIYIITMNAEKNKM